MNLKASLVAMFVLLTTTFNMAGKVHQEYLMEGVYWDVKPFIFYNEETGQMDGIIPEMYYRGHYFCSNSTHLKGIMNFTHALPSRESFHRAIKTQVSANNTWYNNSYPPAFWVPVMESGLDWENSKRYRVFSLMKSDHLALIVRRDLISLPRKFFDGLYNCRQIFVVTILICIVFAVSMWLLEMRVNPNFENLFLTGVGTGLWWSTVSMTTVGYGDITIRSPIGRVLAVVWLVIGVMIGCFTTATMTNIVSGVDYLSVFDKKVAVLDNSYELKAAKYYHSVPVSFTSYEEVIRSVREDDQIFGALVNADVAAWRQRELRGHKVPLSIIKLLPATLYVKCMIPMSISNKSQELIKVMNCMHLQKDEIYDPPIATFKKHCEIENLYIGNLDDLLLHNHIFRSLLILAVFMVAMGLGYDLKFYMKYGHFTKTVLRNYICWVLGLRDKPILTNEEWDAKIEEGQDETEKRVLLKNERKQLKNERKQPGDFQCRQSSIKLQATAGGVSKDAEYI